MEFVFTTKSTHLAKDVATYLKLSVGPEMRVPSKDIGSSLRLLRSCSAWTLQVLQHSFCSFSAVMQKIDCHIAVEPKQPSGNGGD